MVTRLPNASQQADAGAAAGRITVERGTLVVLPDVTQATA